MCGLFGWAVKGKPAEPLQMGLLALSLANANDTRGGDSWGYAYPTGARWKTMKGLGNIANVFGALGRQSIVFAHTRKATTGKVTLRNAHPFRIKGLIGAHNGMIVNHAELKQAYLRDGVQVDSEHIFHHLAEGLDLTELEGYAAVTYAERHNPRRVYLANSHGHLAVANVETPGGQLAVWSSSGKALTEALDLAELPYSLYEMKEHMLHYVEDGQLYVTETEFRVTDAWGYDANSWMKGLGWDDDEDLGFDTNGQVYGSKAPDLTDRDPLYGVRSGLWDDGSRTDFERWYDTHGRFEYSSD